jgi:adenosine deaminase
MTDSERFAEALARNDLDAIRALPKGDLHNHSWLGGRRSYIEARTGLQLSPPPQRFGGMSDLGGYTIGVLLAALKALPDGRVRALEAAYVQAAQDGVSVLAMSFGALMRDAVFGGSVQRAVATLRELHQAHAPHVELRPVLGLNTVCPVEDLIRLLEDHVQSRFYRAIDLYGRECECAVPGLERVCRRARDYGLRVTAHVGEFGEADAVLRAVIDLELDEVQHGIGAAQSPQVMRFLADHEVRLNVCPTSNLRMGRAESYAAHPIRTLYDHGVRVTVNSDDVAVFDQGVSQEFLNLYRTGNWQAEELDEIRRNSLA